MANAVGRISPPHRRLAVWAAGKKSANGPVEWTDYSLSSRRPSRRSSDVFPIFGYSNGDIMGDEENYLYIGLEERFDMAIFFLYSGMTVDYVVWEYHDGQEWIEFVPGIEYDFCETGGERFDRLVGWRKVVIRNHEDSNYENVNMDNDVPDTILRYWVRAHVDNGGDRFNAAQVERVVLRQYAEYCTVAEVAAILQIPNNFSEVSIPSYNTVEDYIHNAQSYIDFRTHKSWRVQMVHNEEHQFNRLGQRLVKHYPIEVIRAEIWDGTKYEIKSQGRGEEYFLVPETSMVHWARFFLLPSRIQAHAGAIWGWGVGEFNFPVRFTYLYGSNIYDNEREGGMVNDIAKKMAAIDVIQTMDFTVLTPSGGDNIALERKSDLWRGEIEDKIDSLVAFTVF